jgi:hypothetical protein
MLTVALAVAATLQNTIEIPFRLADDAIIVDAVVNGRKASFMFDSGFSGALILSDELSIGAPSGTMRLRDFVGEFEARTVKLKSLKLGPLDIPAGDMEVVQKPLSHMSMSYNMHTDGIMGMEVMRGRIFTIDFQRSRFLVHPASHDISVKKPDGKRTFLARMLPIGNNSIELNVETKSGKRMKLALDTGNAFFATTHKDVLQRIGLWDEGKDANFMRTAWVASGPVDSWYKMMRDLNIFGVPVESSVWSIIDLPSSSAEGDGTVGFGFLKNFNITVDVGRRRVWLENFTGRTGNEPVGDIGIDVGFTASGQRARIFRVTPGSPADRAGIKAGDELLGVDGREVLDVGWRQLNRMFEGEVGTTVRLAVSRQGSLARHELKREYLINGL